MSGKLNHLIAATLITLLAGSAVAADRHQEHRHDFAKDVDAFHVALAPLWHARPGKERAQNVCAQTGSLAKLAGDIRSADAKPLLTALTALQQQCQTDPAATDAAFFDVHEAFHQLVRPRGH